MDLNFFADPGLAPRPRSEIRIEQVTLEPYPDRQRVRISVELTPFAPADRPSLEITAISAEGAVLGSTTVIESVQRTFSLTLHLREMQPVNSTCTFRLELYYREDAPQHVIHETLVLSSASSA